MTCNAQSPAAEVIDRQLASLTHLIDDLLTFRGSRKIKSSSRRNWSRCRHGRPPRFPRCGRSSRAAATSWWVLPISRCLLEADSVCVEQILVNLLTNAAKYTPSGVASPSCGFPSNDQAIFKVQDTGIGIPAEMLPRVFELFTQVDQSLDRSQGGLGIGLTVVRKLVEKHGGRVSVNSDGGGLRASSPSVYPCPKPRRPPPAAVSPATISAAQKVLVVDDNVDTAQSISTCSSARVIPRPWPTTATPAWSLLASSVPTSVSLDLGLPGLDWLSRCPDAPQGSRVRQRAAEAAVGLRPAGRQEYARKRPASTSTSSSRSLSTPC